MLTDKQLEILKFIGNEGKTTHQDIANGVGLRNRFKARREVKKLDRFVIIDAGKNRTIRLVGRILKAKSVTGYMFRENQGVYYIEI